MFLGPSAVLRKALYEQAKPVVQQLVAAGSPKDALAAYYGKVFDKYAESAEGALEWLAKEKTRLGAMAAKKGSLAGKQLKEIQQKKNVSFKKRAKTKQSGMAVMGYRLTWCCVPGGSRSSRRLRSSKRRRPRRRRR